MSCRTRPLHQNTAKVNPLILAFSNSDYIHIVPHELREQASDNMDTVVLCIGGVREREIQSDMWHLVLLSVSFYVLYETNMGTQNFLFGTSPT